MFHFFQREVQRYAPEKGMFVSLEQVSDALFAQKRPGDGSTFTYDTDRIHASGIQSANKAEGMLHVGLDNVSQNGHGVAMVITSKDDARDVLVFGDADEHTAVENIHKRS